MFSYLIFDFCQVVNGARTTISSMMKREEVEKRKALGKKKDQKIRREEKDGERMMIWNCPMRMNQHRREGAAR